MSAHFTTPTDELLLLAETLGEVKTKADKLEAEFATQARPLEAATNALSAALSGIKALQFHVLDNNLGALSARVEEMRKAVDEQVGVIALELKKADETNAAKAGQEAEALRSEIAALQAQLGTLGAQFSAQLERVEFSAKEEAKKLQLIPGPAGAAGASLNPRGTFIDGETYNRLDVVSWLGSSYIAAVDGVTEKPSKNSNQWQVLASRGSGGSGGAGDFGSLAGVAQINQGGTGQTTRAAGLNALLPDQAGATQYMLLTDGAGNVSWGAQPVAGLPSQTSNSGKLLTTNGTSASWSNAVTVSGNNAAVTGTLTVNGGTASVASANGTTSSMIRSTVGGTATTGNGIFSSYLSSIIEWQFGGVSSDSSFRISSNGLGTADQFKITSSGNVSIPSTAISSTTSSGALVIGNGTSGGLGVGGAIVAGGTITSTASTDSGLLQLNLVNSSTGTSASSLFRFNAGTRTATLQAYNDTHATLAGQLRVGTSNGDIVVIPSGVTATTFGSSTVTVNHSTASTSTSSGALVVSGGVGVAGAAYFGGTVTVASNFSIASTGFYAGGGTPGAGRFLYSATAGTMLCGQAGSSYDLSLASSTGTVILGVPTGTSNLEAAGSVKTAAPSGGTAAAWKLGTVASVSPTSPNRTIEVDIGGTIYYIHAKTTNN